LTVPFAPEELLARVIALVRRAYSDAVTFTPIIKIGELEIDILNRTVRAGTSELHLTSLEQSLLYLLAANAGRVVTREEILDTLWGVDYVAESNVVDRQIRNLRARLQIDWASTALHCHCSRPRLQVPSDVQREWSGAPSVVTATDGGLVRPGLAGRSDPSNSGAREQSTACVPAFPRRVQAQPGPVATETCLASDAARQLSPFHDSQARAACSHVKPLRTAARDGHSCGACVNRCQTDPRSSLPLETGMLDDRLLC
jgi:Transcriptional regulatory protein, C terminal